MSENPTVSLNSQICVLCAKLHKRCMNAVNNGKTTDKLPCESCKTRMCNNCTSLLNSYDLCDPCQIMICKRCDNKAQKMDAAFCLKCRKGLCIRCINTIECWNIRGIHTHLKELNINSDSENESSSESESDSPVKERKKRVPSGRQSAGRGKKKEVDDTTKKESDEKTKDENRATRGQH